MNWCNNLEELIEFIAYVVLTAPDAFPPEDNMTIDAAFRELGHGLDCVQLERGDSAMIQESRKLFREAYSLYKEGKTNEGAWKLQDAEEVLMRL